MKKIDVPLWSDTLFLFFITFLLSFCVFRFYLSSLAAALAVAIPTALCAAFLTFVRLKSKHGKRRSNQWEKTETEKLSFHLAMTAPRENAAWLAECLNSQKKQQASSSSAAETQSGKSRSLAVSSSFQLSEKDPIDAQNRPPAKQKIHAFCSKLKSAFLRTSEPKKGNGGEKNSENARIKTPQADPQAQSKRINNPHAPAQAAASVEEGGGQWEVQDDYSLKNGQSQCFVCFRFEKMTADELSETIRKECGQKTVFANGFTEEAKQLAAAFGVTLKDAADVYLLAKKTGLLPEKLIEPPLKPSGLKAKLALRLRREAWKGYCFSGCFLLLFSLMTVFPLYYILSGGILLMIAVLIRFFGKPKTS